MRVTRRIGLSREKPQYWQLLMHSLERYSGAKSRIVRPKFCSVSERDVCAIDSRSTSDFGAISRSNPRTSSDLLRSRLSSVFTKDIAVISTLAVSFATRGPDFSERTPLSIFPPNPALEKKPPERAHRVPTVKSDSERIREPRLFRGCRS
jgi:hypothetical protein